MLESSLTTFLEEATARYQETLDQDPEAAAYLADRGIDSQVAHTARLGFTGSEPLPGHDQFANHISIPYVTPSGIVAMKFRRGPGAPENGPKYTAPAGQRVRLYNVTDLARSGDTVLICEGELDTVIASHVLEIVPAVGVAGVSQWKPHFPRMLRGYENVIVCTDNDDKDGTNPGQDLAHRILESIPRARNVVLPKGMDITDYYLAFGVEDTRARLGVHV